MENKLEDALTVFHKLQELAAAQNIEIVAKKCQLLPPPTSNPPLPSSFFDRAKNFGLSIIDSSSSPYLSLLGSTLHRNEDSIVGLNYTDLRKKLSEDVDDRHALFFRQLTHRAMPSQIAYLLLRQSGIPRLSFLNRIMPPKATVTASFQFDAKVYDSFLRICGIPRPKSFDEKMFLAHKIHTPLRLGGFGLTPHSTTRSIAYFSSLMASFFHLNIIFNNDAIPEADRKAARLSVSHHALDVANEIRSLLPPASADELLPSTVDALWLKYGSSPDSAYKLQSKLNHAALKKQSEDRLCHTPSFISCSHPTANLLLTTTPDEEGLMLTNPQFIAAANHRISASVPLKKNLRCSCFPSKQLTDSQHAFSCLLLRKKGSFNRHENIVRTLEDCARSAGAVTSTKAPEDLIRLDKEKELIPDLFIDTGNVKYMIDVSVTYPGASSYSKQASKEQGAAAARREKEKMDKYEKLASRNGYIFVPFVFESYGMLGSHADKFLRDLCHSSNHFINQLQYFKRRLIITLYRGNARVAHEGVKLLM